MPHLLIIGTGGTLLENGMELEINDVFGGYTVQLKGNLINACGCVCRIARVVIRGSAIFYAGNRIHHEANN